MGKRPVEEAPAKAKELSKKLQAHSFNNEEGEEYEEHGFGDFADYFRRKKVKLQNRDAHLRSLYASSDTPQLFKGFIITIQGYTNPSASILHQLIVKHGGLFLDYMDGKTNVTHIIATNLPSKKRVEFARYKVVRPEWITESIQREVLLNWVDYRVIGQSAGQAQLGFASPNTPKLIKPITSTNSSYKQTSASSSGFSSISKTKQLLPTSSLATRSVNRDREIPPSDEEDGLTSSQSFSRDFDVPPPHQPEQTSAITEDDLDSVQLVPQPRGATENPSFTVSFISGVSTELDPSPTAPEPTGKKDGLDLYEPESIIGERKHPANAKPKNKRGKIKYKIKWKGYSESDATWEFEDTLLEDLGEEELTKMVQEFRSMKPPSTQRSSSLLNKRQQPTKKQRPVQKSVVVADSPEVQKLQVQKDVEPPAQPDYSFLIPESFSTVHTSDLDDDYDPFRVLPSNQEGLQQLAQQNPKLNDSHTSAGTEILNVIPESFSTVRLSQISDGEITPKPPPAPEAAPARRDLESTPTKKRPCPTDALTESLNKKPKTMANESWAKPKTSVEQTSKRSSSRITPTKEGEHSAKSSPPITPSKKRENAREPTSKKGPVTAEEFNAELLANPRIRAATVLNPEFLKNYYEESRLHHLSTWKSSLRAELQTLASRSSQPPPKSSRDRRYVIHIDFDCFFAAIATRDRPELKTKPVAITHGNSTNSTSSEIASCNYVARGFGVKNGMWMAGAKKLCPDLVCLGYEFPKYEEASRYFYEVILAVGAERVQAVSIDEALIDVSNLCCNDSNDIKKEEEKAHNIGNSIRDCIREKTRCEVSVGIGPNVLLAKSALRKAKPAGQYMVRSADALSYLEDLKVGSFPGVGGAIVSKITESIGSDIVKDVRAVSKTRLQEILGPKTGDKIYAFCRGVDETLVGETVAATGTAVRRSISVDVNWGVRFENQDQAEIFVHDVAGEVEKRMKQERLKGRTLSLKISKRAVHAPLAPPKFLGSGECDVINRSITFGVATSDRKVFGKEAVLLLRAARISPGELRGLGIIIGKLEEDRGETDGQKKLKFGEVVKPHLGPSVEEEAPVHKVLRPDYQPVAMHRPPVEAYVKPKVTTLLDKFTKNAALKRPPPPEIQPVDEKEKTSFKKELPMTKLVSSGKQVSSQEESFNSVMTQFEIPSMSQIDPSVLKDLPSPYQKAVARKQKELEVKGRKGKEKEVIKEVDVANLEAPPNSQYNRETWNELPQDIRDIVRAEYAEEKRAEELRKAKPLGISPQKHQAALPQSPRRNRFLPWDKPNAGDKPNNKPKKKPRPKPRAKPQPRAGNRRPVYDAWGNEVSSWLFTEGGVDRDWFWNVDVHAQTYAISQAVKKREREEEARRKIIRKEAAERNRIANAFRIPVTRPKAKLTIGEQEVWEMDEVRQLITDWFASSPEDGPDAEDAVGLWDFLRKLVVQEQNTDKAVMTVKFLLRTAGHELRWMETCQRAINAVNDEVEALGRGTIDFKDVRFES